MKTGLPLLAVTLLSTAIAPPLAAEDGPKPDIPGYLVPDATCSGAAYVLLSPCPPNAPAIYVAFPQGKNVDRFVGRLVEVRGEIDPTAPCSLPLVKATRIGDKPVLPPCPPPECQPGDPPPCP